MTQQSYRSSKTGDTDKEQLSSGEELRRTQESLTQANLDFFELSTPLIEVWDGVLAVPLIGTLDSARAQECMEKSLTQMAEKKFRVLIIDITGVPVIDTMVANHLLKLAGAIGMMGGQCILTGISPSTAITVVGLGLDLSKIATRATLADGLQHAIHLLSLKKEA